MGRGVYPPQTRLLLLRCSRGVYPPVPSDIGCCYVPWGGGVTPPSVYQKLLLRWGVDPPFGRGPAAAAATGDMSSVATEDMSSVATEDMSPVATGDMSSVATEDMSSVATEDKSSVATEGTESVKMH